MALQKDINTTATCISHKYVELVSGIIEQAEKDLKNAIVTKNHNGARALKKWFLSDWGQALSNHNGQLIVDRIVAESNNSLKNN